MAKRNQKQFKTKLHKKKEDKKKNHQYRHQKYKKKTNETNSSSENDDDNLADSCDNENNNYLKINQDRTSLKRQTIYSSSSEDENNLSNYKIKGKKSKGLPVKK